MRTQYTITEFKKIARNSLMHRYPEREINSIVDLLLEKKVNLKKTTLLLNPNTTLPEEKTQEMLSVIDELKAGKPIQYILGETEFYDLTFSVDSNTLIPRQETEELVDWIIHTNKNHTAKILDIGTGTGCIAISLARHLPHCQVKALDDQEKTIKKARENACLNNVKVDFFCLDILQHALPENFDVIVSNPPYVLESEKNIMHQNVLEHEPKNALFVPDSNPLRYYKRIVELARIHLTKQGVIYFEINEHFGQQVFQLLEENGFSDVQLKNDINNKPRMIKGIYK